MWTTGTLDAADHGIYEKILNNINVANRYLFKLNVSINGASYPYIITSSYSIYHGANTLNIFFTILNTGASYVLVIRSNNTYYFWKNTTTNA